MTFWRKDDKKKEAEDPHALVARREYDKAVKAYRMLLAAAPGKYIYNHKVADVICLAGRQSESLDDYAEAAEGYARDGFLIKSIAILKKMQKIDPSNPSVAAKLEELSRSGSSRARGAVAAQVAAGAGAEVAFGMEEPDEPPAIPMAGDGLRRTPLFSELEEDELREVMERLRHHSFAPGSDVVKEGEPGDSLFVVCQGRVGVLTTGPRGKTIKLAELGEGDFFGEVSLLTGRPRTATISSLEDTEVLELTKGDLEALEARHPRVRQVIQEFYERRVASTVEAMIQAVKAPR